MISHTVLADARIGLSSGITVTKARLVFVILAVILFILIGIQLVLANHLAAQGQKASDLEAKIKKIEEENKDLKMQINKQGSLKEVQEKAERLGFKKPQKFFFVKENFPVAGNL